MATLDDADFKMWREHRVSHLDHVIEELASGIKLGPRLDRASFAKLFQDARQALEISDDDLAASIRVSRPTIGRWARAETAPHPVGMPGVLKALADMVKKKLRYAAPETAELAKAS